MVSGKDMLGSALRGELDHRVLQRRGLVALVLGDLSSGVGMRMLQRLSLIILVIVLTFHPKFGKSNPNNSNFGFLVNLGV